MTTDAHSIPLRPAFTLADRLRKAREVTGLSTIHFAQKMAISRTTVVNYEHGYRTPPTLYLRAWAVASGVDLDWLEFGDEPRVETLGG